MENASLDEVRRLIQHQLEEAFPEKLSGPRHMGPEEEFPVVDEHGFMADIAPLFPELQKLGWKPKFDCVSNALVGVYQDNTEIGMDVGRGTLEVSFPHVENIFDHLPVREETFSLVDTLLLKHGFHRLADYAIQPRTLPSPEHWAPKGRGIFFRDTFDPSVHAQTLTASSQTHVDVTREEALGTLEVMLALSPVFIALNANSPVWKGDVDSNGLLAVREHCWYPFTKAHGLWNNVLCGSSPVNGDDRHEEKAPATFEELASILSATHFLVRVHDGILEGPGVPFQTWFNNSGRDLDPNKLHDAFLNHEGTVWWDARPRAAYGTIEVRPSCQNIDSLATHALVLGLTENLTATSAFVRTRRYKSWRDLHPIAIQQGLRADGMATIAETVIGLAQDGLRQRGFGEETLLDPLTIRVQEASSPAHTKLKIFRDGGIHALVDHLLT